MTPAGAGASIVKTLPPIPPNHAAGVNASGCCMVGLLRKIWSESEGQDLAEYAVMAGAVLVLLFGLMRAL